MAAIVNHHLRIVDRFLQTPIRAYRNADGRTVWLVGLVHTGERSYFERIRDRVVGLQKTGVVVHYESTAMSPPEIEAAAPTEAEREAMRLTADVKIPNQTLMAGWGWVDQLDGFTGIAREPGVRRCWPEGWEQHDIRLIDVIRGQGVEQIIARLREQATALDAANASWLAGKLFLAQTALSYWMLAYLPRPPKPSDAVVLDQRNDKAIRDCEAVPGDVVLLWGTAHLDGLEARLRERSYARVEETWHSVGRLPRLSTAVGWLMVGALAGLRHVPARIAAGRKDRGALLPGEGPLGR
jgi:hypothetical protein